MIKNIDHLKQPVDFSKLPCYGQDIDWFTDFDRSVFLGADFKFDKATLTTGQRITAQNLVSSLGKVSPTFYAVVQHQFEAPDVVLAAEGLVREVYYSWPSLNKMKRRVYADDEMISFGVWIGSIATIYWKHDKLNPNAKMRDWLHPDFMLDDVFSLALESDEAKAFRAKYGPIH